MCEARKASGRAGIQAASATALVSMVLVWALHSPHSPREERGCRPYWLSDPGEEWTDSPKRRKRGARRREATRQKGIKQLMLKTHFLAVSFYRRSRTFSPRFASALDNDNSNPAILQQVWELKIKDDGIRPELLLVLSVEW